jgi:hypothetical protein
MEHNAPWGIKTMAEELNQEETLDENNDSLNVEEEVETEEVETDNSPTLEDYEALQKKNKELFERAKKAEAQAKAKKESPLIKTNETTSSDEEKLLKLAKLANQLDEEDLELLKTINGASLEDKINNPLFKAYKAQSDKKKKSEASTLKPSGFSAGTGINKPDLTPEEHKKLWEKSIR